MAGIKKVDITGPVDAVSGLELLVRAYQFLAGPLLAGAVLGAKYFFRLSVAPSLGPLRDVYIIGQYQFVFMYLLCCLLGCVFALLSIKNKVRFYMVLAAVFSSIAAVSLIGIVLHILFLGMGNPERDGALYVFTILIFSVPAVLFVLYQMSAIVRASRFFNNIIDDIHVIYKDNDLLDVGSWFSFSRTRVKENFVHRGIFISSYGVLSGVVVSILLVLSYIMYAIVFVFILIAPMVIDAVIRLVDGWAFYVFWGAAGGIAIAVVSRWVLRLCRYGMRVSYDKSGKVDQRTPILYLRSFQDDQLRIPIQEQSIIDKLLVMPDAGGNLEQLVQACCRGYGPLVAIGRPSDFVAPLGAARAYVDDSRWQSFVSELARKARNIIFVPDTTEGVVWERNFIAADRLNEKVIVIFPFMTMPEKRVALTAIASGLFHLPAAVLDEGERPIAMFKDGESVTFVVSRAPSETTYRYGLAHALALKNAPEA